jgi:hypothetical protein
MEHLERAEEFYQAFRDLDIPERLPPNWPRYFLLCHAIELALKAYLLFHGATADEIKNPSLRHNLKELLEQAIQKGLPIGPCTRSELELLHDAHTKYWPRYPKQDANLVFILDPFEPYAVELLCSVATALLSRYKPDPTGLGTEPRAGFKHGNTT